LTYIGADRGCQQVVNGGGGGSSVEKQCSSRRRTTVTEAVSSDNKTVTVEQWAAIKIVQLLLVLKTGRVLLGCPLGQQVLGKGKTVWTVTMSHLLYLWNFTKEENIQVFALMVK
jgi:hypothetical protein